MAANAHLTRIDSVSGAFSRIGPPAVCCLMHVGVAFVVTGHAQALRALGGRAHIEPSPMGTTALVRFVPPESSDTRDPITIDSYCAPTGLGIACFNCGAVVVGVCAALAKSVLILAAFFVGSVYYGMVRVRVLHWWKRVVPWSPRLHV